MSRLFEPTTLNGMPMANRLIRSATWEGMCDDAGRPGQKLIDCYTALAHGGVGLIVSGYAFVTPTGKQLPGKLGIDNDSLAGDFRLLIDAVHTAGGRLAIQLVHAGGQTNAGRIGQQPLAPSAVAVPQFQEVPAALEPAAIRGLVQAFAAAARRAKAWGADAVQLHGAHGYLINQFLSPLTNRRTDAWGGSLENRCRFLMEVYQAVRAVVGRDFPVLIKLNSMDNIPGGLELEDSIYAAKRLSDAGIDAIEVSSGTPASGAKSPVRKKINKPEREAYHREAAMRIKAAVQCPVALVGGIRSFAIAERTVAEDGLDYVALSRPLIREPGLPRRWMSGDRRPSPCVSCSECFTPGLTEGGIYCVVEKKQREKAQRKANKAKQSA